MSTPVLQLSGSRLASGSWDPDCQEWVFQFSGGITLRVAAPWRLVAAGSVALGWQDHDQQFGLPEHVDAPQRLRALIGTRTVVTASYDDVGDLAIVFEGDGVLEVFNASSGYEGWTLHGPGERWVVAQGGGCVVESEPNG